MNIRFFNNTEEIIILTDYAKLSFLPGEYTEIDTLDNNIQESDNLIHHISEGNLTVNNYSRDMGPTEGIRWILTGAEQFTKDAEGKILVKSSAKRLGQLIFWTGYGDDTTNNVIGNGEPMMSVREIGDPTTQIKYIDFNTINNMTQLYEGYLLWCSAQPGDRGSLSVVTSVVETIASSGTNYRLYNGYLVVPAAGDGDIEILSDITDPDPTTGCLVECDINELGNKTPGYWNADFDPIENKFSNITPAPYGDGDYNMFAQEVTVIKFANKINLLNSGNIRLNSTDADTINHGLRLKLELETDTTIEDHKWSISVILTLQREQTI